MLTTRRTGLAAALLIFLATAAAGSTALAGAAGRPGAPTPPDFDVRVSSTPSQPGVRADKGAQSRLAAQNRLRSSLGPSGVLDLDAVTGTVRSVSRLSGALTAASSAAPATVARAWVRTHATALGLTSADVDALGTPKTVSAPGAITTVRFPQSVRGVPAFDSELRAAVDKRGRLVQVGGSPARGLSLASVTPAITAEQAMAVISRSVGAGDGPAVASRARLHILVTGSELLPLGAPPEPGKIHESNGLMVRLLAERAGADVIDQGVIGDDFESTRAAVETGLAGDVLVVSGGVSVGPHDHVKPAFEACGVEEIFWRVRVKPGKPLWFGRRGATLVFGLPGNPLSSIVGFLAFIEPALRRLHGERDPAMRTVKARLTEAAGPSDGRTTFLTSQLRPGADGVLEATPTATQGSHLTGALGQSDGFAVAPHGSGPLPAGVLVDAVRFA